MYVSVRDCMVDCFPTPAEGMKHLGVEAAEIELSDAFEVCAMDSREKIRLDSDEDAAAYRKHLEGLGLRGCSFLTVCDFSVRDAEDSAAWLARAIELASLLGMSNIRIDSAMKHERELDFRTRVNLFAEGIGKALERTEGLDVAMGIENHGFQGNNLAFLLNVFKRVGSERLGSCLDTGNFYWRGYPLSEVYGILNILAPFAKHTHLKNINYPKEMREQTREAGWEYHEYVCPLDEGDIDHARVVPMLVAAGYEEDLCIEDESLGQAADDTARIKILERDVAHVKSLLT